MNNLPAGVTDADVDAAVGAYGDDEERTEHWWDCITHKLGADYCNCDTIDEREYADPHGDW